jgi:hypothetical protein
VNRICDRRRWIGATHGHRQRRLVDFRPWYLRGVYALVTQDITEDNEPMMGRAAARYGAILVAIGLAFASHAIFEWPWITALVNWLRQTGLMQHHSPGQAGV